MTLEPEIRKGYGFFACSPILYFLIGSDSPVIEDSSHTKLLPYIKNPSTGKTSPVSMCIISPTKSEYIEIWTVSPFLITPTSL